MEKWLIHGSSCSSDAALIVNEEVLRSQQRQRGRKKGGEGKQTFLSAVRKWKCISMQAAMNIFTQQKRFDYGGLFTFPPGEKRCNSTTGFWVSYDLCSSHNNSTTQLGSVIKFGKTPKMPYSTKLTFYPGEALIKFEIFHCRWGESNAKAE